MIDVHDGESNQKVTTWYSKISKCFWKSYLIFLNEADEGGPFYLDRLTCAVVQGDHEVEEV